MSEIHIQQTILTYADEGFLRLRPIGVFPPLLSFRHHYGFLETNLK